MNSYWKGFKRRIASINKTIIYLTMADVFSWIPLDLIDVFIGLYLATQFGEDTVKFVGIGLAIKSLTIGVAQLPIGYLVDRVQGLVDEVVLLVTSSLLMGGVFLLYPLINSPEVYYILQFIFGIGIAFNMITWRKLFALSLDKNQEGLEYGVYQAVYSLSKAILGLTAGYVASLSEEYFELVVSAIGLIVIAGSIWPILIYRANKDFLINFRAEKKETTT